MRLALISTKGGTAKTTSSVFLASILRRQGRTLAVDADPQGSLMAWSSGGSLPFTVVSLPVKDIHRRLADLAADYEHVVVDTPPGDLGIIRSAVLAVPLVVVPVSTTGLDVDRLRPTWEILADLEPTHPLGLGVGVLLTKVRRGTRSRREAREVLTGLGYPVLETEIPLAESPYAVSFGTSPPDFGAYEDLLAELKAS
jgi:chromosome partitioning protein